MNTCKEPQQGSDPWGVNGEKTEDEFLVVESSNEFGSPRRSLIRYETDERGPWTRGKVHRDN